MLNLPDDKLFLLCENLDYQSLGRFTRANKRINSVCWDVLRRKRMRKLAEILEENHQAMKPSDIEIIAGSDEEIDFNDFISRLRSNGSGFITLFYPNLYPEDYDPVEFINLISGRYPETVPVEERHDYPKTIKKDENFVLRDDEKAFLDTLVRFMVKDTEYVIGLNSDGSFKTILVPYDVDVIGIPYHKSMEPDFDNYIQTFYITNYNKMMNKFLR